MRIALTDVLPGGQAGATVVHLAHDWNVQTTLCDQYEDGRVAHRGTTLDVDCMTCLVRAGHPTIEDRMAAALGVPKELLFANEREDDGADDR